MKSATFVKHDIEGIAPPEPDLVPEEMIRRAEAMREVLRSAQAAAEAAGNISAETNQAMVDAGFFRVIQPRVFGGYGFDLPTYSSRRLRGDAPKQHGYCHLSLATFTNSQPIRWRRSAKLMALLENFGRLR